MLIDVVYAYVCTRTSIHTKETHVLLLLPVTKDMFAKQPHGANKTVFIVSSSLCEVAKLGFCNWSSKTNRSIMNVYTCSRQGDVVSLVSLLGTYCLS